MPIGDQERCRRIDTLGGAFTAPTYVRDDAGATRLSLDIVHRGSRQMRIASRRLRCLLCPSSLPGHWTSLPFEAEVLQKYFLDSPAALTECSSARFDRLSRFEPGTVWQYLFNSKDFVCSWRLLRQLQLSFFRHLYRSPSLCEIVSRRRGRVRPVDPIHGGHVTTFACPGHCGLVERTPLSAPPESSRFTGSPSSCTAEQRIRRNRVCKNCHPLDRRIHPEAGWPDSTVRCSLQSR